jgi:CBS domain-containing protein
MKVRDVMHKGVVSIEPDATLAAVAAKMREHDIGCVPVCEKIGKPLGMITDRDITLRAFASGKDVAKLAAKDVMTPDLVYCQASEEAEDAMRIMESKQIRRLPVLDESNKLVGMLALGDISSAMAQGLTGEVTKAVSAHHA